MNLHKIIPNSAVFPFSLSRAHSRTLLAGLSLALGLATSALAHEDHHPAAPASAQPVVAASTPLAARFDLKYNQVKTDWYLWREADRIETASAVTGQNQVWERQAPGEYRYRRVFNKDHRVVEYTPGEIKTQNLTPDWAKLASVVSPQLLADLKRGPVSQRFGQKAVRYSGQVGGQKIDLVWLEEAKVPARLSMIGKGQRLEMQLKELLAQAPADWPRTSEEKIADYGLLDASDFGDMEQDPFVARVLRQDGHDHDHGGHAH